MNILQISDARERHLGRAIQLQAQQHGDKPYLLFSDDVYTFAEVNQRVNELAAGLAGLGLKPGEHSTPSKQPEPGRLYCAGGICSKHCRCLRLN